MANPFDLTRGLFQGSVQQEPMWSPVPTEQETRNEQLMNSIDSTLKNWGAAMALRSAAKRQPQQEASVQEQNLRKAEQDLREAKEADAQSGSEGYEAKENGVFSRLASWGNSIGEYLFGKDTRSEAEKLADEVLEKAEAERIAKEKEERGILGYYGGNALGALVGTNFKKDWDSAKKDIQRQGLLGYIPQKVNESLETMAQSPMSNFMDPTTLLGGQRTMVNNIDKYFDTRGLGALRDDLVTRDMLNNQTLMGQAKQYAKASPEERAAIDQYLRMRYPSRGQSAGAEDPLTAVRQRVVDAINSGIPIQQALQEGSDESGIPVENILYGRQAGQNALKTLSAKDQLAYDQAERDVARNPENYLGDTYEDKLYDAFRKRQREGQYQAQSPIEEFNKAAAREQAGAFGGKEGTLAEIEKAAMSAPVKIESARVALGIINDNPNFTGGGTIGSTIENIIRSGRFSTDEEADKARAQLKVALDQVYLGQMEEVISKINKGSISDSERTLFNSLVANLGDSPEELKARLRLFILLQDLQWQTYEKMLSLQDLPYNEQQAQLREYLKNRSEQTKEDVRHALGGIAYEQ